MRTSRLMTAAVIAAVMIVAGCAGPGDGEVSVDDSLVCALSSRVGFAIDENDQVRLALDSIVQESGIRTQYAEGVEGAQELASAGCSLIIGVGSGAEEGLLAVANEHSDIDVALLASPLTTDAADLPPNASSIVLRASQASFLAGYAAAGMTTTGLLATVGGTQDASTQAQMEGFAKGVEAYNLAHGTSVLVNGWDLVRHRGTFAESADAVEKAFTDELNAGADIFYPVAGSANRGGAEAIKKFGVGPARLIWSGIGPGDAPTTKGRQSGAQSGSQSSTQSGSQSSTQSSAQSDPQYGMAQSGAQSPRPSPQVSGPALPSEVIAQIGAPVFTAVTVDMRAVLADLVTASAGSSHPDSIDLGLGKGIDLAGFGVYEPLLSNDLRTELFQLRKDITSGDLDVTTVFDPPLPHAGK